MKTYTWQIKTEEEIHEVSYTFARMKGQMTVTIDGDDFALPAGFLGCKCAKREIFRLGDEQAILVVDKKGVPTLLFQGQAVAQGVQCDGEEQA